MQAQQPFDLRQQLRHTGSTDQLYEVRRTQVTEGSAAGMRFIEVTTAAGLQAVFCESKALDLYNLRFKGINIGFLSKNGLINGRAVPLNGTFASAWPGGMLTTCGMRNTGPGCEVNGAFHQVHGLVGGVPAEHVSVQTDLEQGILEICGEMRESELFGHNLLLQRRIRISLMGSAIEWHDTVVNQAAEAEPVFLLYHFNFGYPFLGPALQLHFPAGQVIPRTETAEKGLAEHNQISEPSDGCPEQVFFHLPLPEDQGKQQTVRLVRPDLRLAANLSWSHAELPWLVQWKSMKTGDYALGIEPSTSQIRGRAEELKAGYAHVVQPYGQKDYHLDLAMEALS